MGHTPTPIDLRSRFCLAAWFPFVWRSIEKNQQKKLKLLIYFAERFKIFHQECVLIFLSLCYNLVLWYELNKK